MGRSETLRTKKDLYPSYKAYDQLILDGWEFEISMVIQKKYGIASALQGGRITSFELMQSGETVGAYEDGKWIIPMDTDNDEALIALAYFLEKHNKKRPDAEERNMWIHEH